jgi:hypothetical protein
MTAKPTKPVAEVPDEIPPHNSNEQLHVAADKRRAAEDEHTRGGRADERGFTQR